jgi:septal ring factor EnvC (AmiA/AmiB activator)
MTNKSSSLITNIVYIIGGISAFIFAIAYSYSQWKRGVTSAESEALTTYQAELNLVKDTLKRVQEENKAQAAQLNQLIGENKTLKETLTYQDPKFRDTIKSILDEIKKMREDFEQHAKDDNIRFVAQGEGINKAKTVAEDNNRILRELGKEIRKDK